MADEERTYGHRATERMDTRLVSDGPGLDEKPSRVSATKPSAVSRNVQQLVAEIKKDECEVFLFRASRNSGNAYSDLLTGVANTPPTGIELATVSARTDKSPVPRIVAAWCNGVLEDDRAWTLLK